MESMAQMSGSNVFTDVFDLFSVGVEDEREQLSLSSSTSAWLRATPICLRYEMVVHLN